MKEPTVQVPVSAMLELARVYKEEPQELINRQHYLTLRTLEQKAYRKYREYRKHLIGWAVYANHVENREWEEFKTAHACKVISKESDSIGFGNSTSGNMTTIIIPGKTGWLCNDGVTYFH